MLNHMLTIGRACVYYVALITYTWIYALISDLFQILNKISPIDPVKKATFNNFVKYLYAHAMMLILETCGVTIHLSNKIKSNRMIWISNHRSKLDGIIIQCFLYANGNANTSVVKKSISLIPFFGQFGKNVESIFIDRNNSAKEVLATGSEKSIGESNSILIFPEGATLSPDSKSRSDKYADQNNLGKFDNVLVPKIAGLDIVKTSGKFDIIGDLTLRYESPTIPGITEHSYLDLFRRFPRDIYIDVNYHNVTDIDLYKIYKWKDTKLAQPLMKSNYTEKNNYSVAGIVFNGILLPAFVYSMYNIDIIRYPVLIVTAISTIGLYCR